MAIVTDRFEITVTFADRGQNTSTMTFACRDAAYADVITAKTGLVAALALVSGCTIARLSVNEIWKNDAFAYPTLYETAEKASLTINLTGGTNKKANMKIPGPLPSYWGAVQTAGFNVVDTSNADLLAYVALFAAAGDFYISDGEDALSLASGKRIHSKQYDG